MTTLSPNDYMVGWICAVDKEHVAAQAFLDEEYDGLDEQPVNDNNTYTLGRVGKHHVVIAVLPHWEYGLVNAASAARDLVRSFPNVRITLMVGIGGGVPTKHDIRLGDVVVSSPSYANGGVYQYDFGMTIQNREFTATGFLNKPPTFMMTAVNDLKARYRLKGNQLEATIGKVLDAYPRIREEYQRPDAKTDRLYKSDIIHTAGEGESCSKICGYNNSVLVTRKERPSTNDNPAIYYGLIASANQLMKDALVRDKLAAEKDVLCFEMEAAGLMNNFPCLVIRGICDYSDSHKNEEWQGYAAMTAAAYAKDLLSRIPPNKVEAEKRISEVLLTVSKIPKQLETVNLGLKKAFQQREKHHSEQVVRHLTEDQRDCHRVFKTSTYEEYKNNNPDRIEGTCEWVLKSDEYLRWWNTASHDLLWISADLGCGKSVLAKSLIDDIFRMSDPNISTVYFFFKDNDEQNSLTTALCAVLHQLFTLQPQLLRHALPFWERNREKIQHEAEDLWRILIAATSDPEAGNIICVFDALDECRGPDQKRLIEKLQKHYKQARPSAQENWLKFLATSRPYDDIVDYFQPVIEFFPKLHLRGEEENDQIHHEINLVVKIRVAELSEKLKLKTEMRDLLLRELLQMEHRTYLWLHLAIEDIYAMLKDSLRPYQGPIHFIPKTVDEAYEKILNRVTTHQEATVRTILQIIVGARRPLNIQEMAMALGLADNTRQAKTAEDAGISAEGLGDKLRRLCGLFVFIRDSRIYLIHQTAREFLIAREHYGSTQWRQSVKIEDANLVLSKICMTYLCQWEHQGNNNQLSKESEDSTESDELLWYSATYWITHLKSTTTPTDEVLRLAESLCSIEKLPTWNGFVEAPFWYYKNIDEPLPFFWAARWGLVDVARRLMQDIEITDDIMEKAASHVSSENLVMRLLLDRKGDDIKITPRILEKAAANIHSGDSIIKLLLDRRGDEIRVTDEVMKAAAANESCGLSIMKLLLDRKGDEIKITNGVMISAVTNWNGADITKCLLKRKGAQIRITRSIIRAALKNIPPEKEAIFQMLHPRSPLIQRILRQRRRYQRDRKNDARKWNFLIKE